MILQLAEKQQCLTVTPQRHLEDKSSLETDSLGMKKTQMESKI